MSKIIRIGTRDSELAIWQANTVKDKLSGLGYKAVLLPVKSQGDLALDKPLYELGITGIFTKTLDVAMIRGEIDIAVHSMKDVPTALPKGIVQTAVLERAETQDILVHKGIDFLDTNGIIATGSLRRKAQWLHRYPKHKLVNLRGNINSRLQKLADNNWNGAIFALTGLKRINLLPKNVLVLDWMVPAPAQGAIMGVTMDNDTYCKDALAQLNHTETEITTAVEREFLKTLEGGCTAPIGALATIKNNSLSFTAVLFSLDGSKKISVEKSISLNRISKFGKTCAEEVLRNGGEELMIEIKIGMLDK